MHKYTLVLVQDPGHLLPLRSLTPIPVQHSRLPLLLRLKQPINSPRPIHQTRRRISILEFRPLLHMRQRFSKIATRIVSRIMIYDPLAEVRDSTLDVFALAFAIGVVGVLDAEGLEAGDALEAEEVVDFCCVADGVFGGDEGDAGCEGDGVFDCLGCAVAGPVEAFRSQSSVMTACSVRQETYDGRKVCAASPSWTTRPPGDVQSS